MQRPHVPKFGTWDANANGPAYTAVFDHARAGKGGKPFNPNDPAENEALGGMMGGPPQRPPARGRMAASNNDQGKDTKIHFSPVYVVLFIQMWKPCLWCKVSDVLPILPHLQLLECANGGAIVGILDEVPSARPRHERRSSREDLDVRKSSDPPGRQPPAHDQPPARRPPGGVGGEGSAPCCGGSVGLVCNQSKAL